MTRIDSNLWEQKESFTQEKSSISTGYGLEHQNGRRDVMWKRSITWKGLARSRYFFYRDWKQCAWAVCYPLSCFSLGSFAGSLGKRDYLENFHPGSRHHNTGIPANRSGWLARLSYNGKVDFYCVKLRCRYLYKASQPGSCNQAPSSIARLNALPLDLADFLKPPRTSTQNFNKDKSLKEVENQPLKNLFEIKNNLNFCSNILQIQPNAGSRLSLK